MVANISDLIPMEIASPSNELKSPQTSIDELPSEIFFVILNSIPLKDVTNVLPASRKFTSCSTQFLDVYLKKMHSLYDSLPYLSNEFKEEDYTLPILQQIEKLRKIFNSQDATEQTPLIRTTISMKVKPSDASTLSSLLEFGVNPNGLGKNGWTALHYAAFWSNKAAWKILIEAGANPDLKTLDSRKSGLELAASKSGRPT